jgi:lipopolysaccharide export system permease protein
MKIKLWEQHVILSLFNSLLFFLVAFFLLYSMIDFSTHFSEFRRIKEIYYDSIIWFYLLSFIKRVDILIPLGFLLAAIKKMIEMNTKNQLVILSSNGLSHFQILRPFFTSALIVSIILGASFEFLYPYSLSYIESFEDTFLGKNNLAKSHEIKKGRLSDGSQFFYKSLHPITKEYNDVFIIKSISELWKIKKLQLGHLCCAKDLYILKKDHGDFQLHEFHTSMNLGSLTASNVIEEMSFESQSLRFLLKHYMKSDIASKKIQSSIATHLFYKITVLFLSFLTIICCAPFCLIFSRKLPIFMIYAISIFGMICYFTLLDGAIIIGESGKKSSEWLTICPFLLIFLLFFPKFIKSCKN